MMLISKQHIRCIDANPACFVKSGAQTCAFGFKLGTVRFQSVSLGISFNYLFSRPYNITEALAGYKRAAATHNWTVSGLFL